MRSREYAGLLLSPAFLLLVLVIFFPILRCIWLSFTETDLLGGRGSVFVGLENYARIFKDLRFGKSLFNTAVFTVISVFFEFILGMAIALLLNRTFKGRGLVRACVLIPWVLPPAIMAMAWGWIYNDTYGVLGDILLRMGLVDTRIAWLGTAPLAMASAILADVWKATPFISLVLLAGLQSIPQDLYEALSIDGAGPIKRFTMITLPLLRPYIIVALLFRAIQAFSVFDLIWVLTGGGPGGGTQTVSLYIYDTVFRYLQLGYGAALAITLVIFLFATASLFLVLFGRSRVEV